MIHPSPSFFRVLPIARMMHHDLVIRVLHRANCWRVLPHARADYRTYVSLKCAVYFDRRWGSWLLFRHSVPATLALACRCVFEHATPLGVTHTARVGMSEIRTSHDSPIADPTQSPAYRAHNAP